MDETGKFFGQQESISEAFVMVGVWYAKAKRVVPVLSKFATGQLAVQLLNTANGFFLLRWLSIEQQALFSIGFALQCMLIGLSDIGLTSAITAMVGTKVRRKGLIDMYVQTARSLRNRFFIIGIFICSVVYAIILPGTKLTNGFFWLNLLPVILASFWQTNFSIFAAPILIHKQLDRFYLPQVITSAARLLSNYWLYLLGIVSSLLALALNALVLLCNATYFKRLFLQEKADSLLAKAEEGQAKREMLAYLKPLIPVYLFYAISSQVQVFVMAIFGEVKNVAEVAALGRLAQLFLLLNTFNTIIVNPYLAKTKPLHLKRTYSQFVVFGLAVSAFFMVIAIGRPDIYLLVLGEKYAHLTAQVPLIIGTSCIVYMQGLIWTMNCSRKWNFQWGTWLYIVGVIIIQIVGIATLDVSTLDGVILLGFLVALYMLLIQIAAGFIGFKRLATVDSCE